MPDHFDAHCHLQDLPIGGAAETLARARAAGVARMACCATSEADWDAVLDFATVHGEVIPMLGLHPWHVAGATAGWEVRLEARLAGTRAGVGECGLDFVRRPADREPQVKALRLQLRLAARLHRPVALHCVRAWGTLLAVLDEAGPPPAGALVHAFTGSPEMARALQDRGFFLSFKAPCAALAAARRDRLLVESDGDPQELAARVEDLARGRGMAPADLAGLTRWNGERCFKEILP